MFIDIQWHELAGVGTVMRLFARRYSVQSYMAMRGGPEADVCSVGRQLGRPHDAPDGESSSSVEEVQAVVVGDPGQLRGSRYCLVATQFLI